MKMDIIKEAPERASEYAEYVVELYEKQKNKIRPKSIDWDKLEKDAAWLKENKPKDEILLCFKIDPYPREDNLDFITGKAIEILKGNGLKFIILTENGMNAIPDFEGIKRYKNVRFGIKISAIPESQSDRNKLNEQFQDFHFKPLDKAKNIFKIKTFVDLNPAVDPALSLQLIYKLYKVVDLWKVGKSEFKPKAKSKTEWKIFKKDAKAKDLFKTLGGRLLWTKNVLKINEKDPRLLLIAPHGVATIPKDDINTDELTNKIAERLKCRAIVNDVVSRLYLDFNTVDEASKHKKFISAIEKAVKASGRILVVWVHGIDEKNLKSEIQSLGVKKDIQCLVGYGQPRKHTAYKKTVDELIRLFEANSIITHPARDGSNYCGHSNLYMNQWFRLNKYKLKDVESVQLEFKLKGIRKPKDLDEASQNIANALSKLVNLPVTVEAKVEDPTVPEDPMVAEAFAYLKGIFQRHFHEAMLEAGHYIIATFYGGDPRAAFAKNKIKEQPLSLKRLIEKIRQSSNNPSENAPSVGWLYNAVNLAAHEAICKQERFQTFGILGHSHKLQLLHVPKLKQIEKDKFDEAIRPAFKIKDDLAIVAVEKKLSVREFKEYINEQHPDDSVTIELIELLPLNEVRQLESKELLRLWNLAKGKVNEGQKMIGVCSKAIHKLGIVLAETDTNVELGKGRFQDWTKSKNNFNICTGCKNDCVYCYMKPINAKNPKLKQPEDWHNWELRQNDVDKKYRLRDGLVGFPTSHDIFPDILGASLNVLGKILRAGNEVLIVSKPGLECIKAICAASTFFKDKILFRFTIGTMSDDILSYWEPNASTYDERKECLEYALDNGFRTSVSMEPMLDSPNIEALVKDLLPFVSEDIWLGTMNHLSWFKKGADKRLLAELDIIETGQTPEMLLAINKTYENNPKIKWKTDALKIIERAKERESNIQKSTELVGNKTYTESEWNGAIASMGRLVDIRNFPDVAADVLLGKREAFLGQGYKGKAKALNPEIIGALVFWTKGPAELLVEHPGLKEVLELYNSNRAVVGLQLSVTGFGGTFLEPGIQSPEEVAFGLEKILDTGLISPEAVTLRYDPLMIVKAPDGRILSNASLQAFEKVASLFSKLGIKDVETKFLLLSEKSDDKYHHVWKRMQEAGVIPVPVDDNLEVFSQLSKVAVKYDMEIFSCSVKEEQNLPGWTYDSACLSASRLTKAGKKQFGKDWDRLPTAGRSSRLGCMCSRYFDLSNIKGHKKCGSQDAACIYCTASSKAFGKTINDKLTREIEAFKSGERDDYYRHLLDSD